MTVNRIELERELRWLGGTVEIVNGTGELLYRHPLTKLRMRVNGRRKDATRRAECWLRIVRGLVDHASRR